MRITGVKILGFGCWVDQTLEFQPDYQVIWGNNESGKTTLLHFIRSILFGFATARGHKKYLQYIPHNSSQYGGEVYLTVEQTPWTVRRIKKGKKNEELSVFRGSEPVALAEYQDLIAPMTATLFGQTNFIDRTTLDQVYQLTDDQLLEAIMTVGAVGSKDWLQLAHQFTNNADQMYRPRGKKLALNQLLQQSGELQTHLTDLAIENQDFQKLAQQVTQIQSQKKQLQKQITQQQHQLDQQQHLLQLWPQYQKWQELQATKYQPEIASADWQHFEKLQQQLQSQQQVQTNLQAQQAQLQLSQAEQTQLQYYQAHATELHQLQATKQQLDFTASQIQQQVKPQQQEVEAQIQTLLQQTDCLQATTQPLSSTELSTYQQLQQEIKDTKAAAKAVTGVDLPATFSKPSVVFVLSLLVGGLTGGISHNWFLTGVIFLLALGLSWWGLHYVRRQSQVSEQKVAAAATALQQFQTKHHLPQTPDLDILTWQTQAAQMSHYQTRLVQLQEQVQQYQQALDHWRQQTQNQLPDAIAPAELAHYCQRMEKLQQRQEQLQQQQLTDQIADLQQQHKQTQASLIKLLQQYHVTTAEELEQLHRQNLADVQQREQQRVLQQTLKTALPQLQQIDTNTTLENQISALQTTIQTDQKQLAVLNEQQAQWQAEQQHLADDNQFAQVQQEVEFNKAAIQETFTQWLSNQLAALWISTTLNQASSNRYPHMLARAQQFFARLTNQRYRKIEFIKQELAVVNAQKDRFTVRELSRGTATQLFLAFTLAFALEVADLSAMPLLIDDALVDCDQVRRSNIVGLIQELAATTQIIYTCTDIHTANLFAASNVLQLGKDDH